MSTSYLVSTQFLYFFQQIFQAKTNVPSDTYNFFMNILLNTLRNEIAECLQKAYKKVSFTSATKMLNFNSTAEMNDFANKVNIFC